uniref:Putative PAS/PAC sensor protein n=1 Tax=Solibacter usitatus (strain Ellin6076) TaxID=234267 RepID=Q01U92_SOLUE
MSGSARAKVTGAEERFRLLLEAAPDAVVVTKQSGKIVLVNSQTERLFGYGREELIGRMVDVLLPQRVQRRHVKSRAAYIQHPAVRPMGTGVELYARRKDGTEFPIDVSLSPVETGGEVLISSSIRDITERKRSEELVSHLAAIVAASDDAIIGRSLNGTIVSWNSGAERLYGYQAGEMIGQSGSALLPPGKTDETAQFTKVLRHGDHIEHYETTRLHKDGHPIEVSVTVSPVKGSAGTVIGSSVIGRDITKQKTAEEALRQSEERFRLALKHAPIAVFNQDKQLRYTWINSPALAWGKQEYLGHTDAEIFGGEEGARLTAIKREVLRSGIGTRTEIEATSQGETYYLDMVVEPLRDVRGTLAGLTCSASDITHTKKSLLERERLVAQLQEALEEVKRLSGLLSICAGCKKITNERGDWEPLESYLQAHSEAKFSHGLCPECLRKLYPEQFRAWEQSQSKDRTKK